MNERLETLLDTVRRTAGQLGGTAADAAWGVGKRAEESVLVEKDGAADAYLSESWSYYIEARRVIDVA